MDLQGSAQDVGSGGREHGSSTSEASTEQPGPGRTAAVARPRGPRRAWSRRRGRGPAARLMGGPRAAACPTGRRLSSLCEQPVSGGLDTTKRRRRRGRPVLSSNKEPASPRHRAGDASMAWRSTWRVSTNAPRSFDFHTASSPWPASRRRTAPTPRERSACRLLQSRRRASRGVGEE